MSTRSDVATILESSPLSGRLGSTEAAALSVDLTEVAEYLAMLVEELRVLHEAVLALGARVDELATG